MQKLDMVMMIVDGSGMSRSFNTTPAKGKAMVGDQF